MTKMCCNLGSPAKENPVRVSAADRREQLIDAAWRVMTREGVAATTTRRIVDEAGMRLGSFHYCFRSKDELIQELIRRNVAEELAAARAGLVSGADARQALQGSLSALWAKLCADRDRQLVINELTALSLRDPAMTALPEWKYEQYLVGVAEFLTAIAESSAVTWELPVPVAARLLLSVLVGAVDIWMVTGDEAAGLRTLEVFSGQLARMCGPVEPAGSTTRSAPEPTSRKAKPTKAKALS